MDDKRPRQIDGWRAFLGWLLVGFFASWIPATFTVGPIAALLVIVLGGLLWWSRPPARTLLGLASGAGLGLMTIGLVRTDDTTRALLAVGAALLVVGAAIFFIAQLRAGGDADVST